MPFTGGLNNMEMQQVNVSAGRGELSSGQLMTLGREMFIREQIGLQEPMGQQAPPPGLRGC